MGNNIRFVYTCKRKGVFPKDCKINLTHVKKTEKNK